MLRVIALQFVSKVDKSLSYKGGSHPIIGALYEKHKECWFEEYLAPCYNNLFEVTKKKTSVLQLEVTRS